MSHHSVHNLHANSVDESSLTHWLSDRLSCEGWRGLPVHSAAFYTDSGSSCVGESPCSGRMHLVIATQPHARWECIQWWQEIDFSWSEVLKSISSNFTLCLFAWRQERCVYREQCDVNDFLVVRKCTQSHRLFTREKQLSSTIITAGSGVSSSAHCTSKNSCISCMRDLYRYLLRSLPCGIIFVFSSPVQEETAKCRCFIKCIASIQSTCPVLRVVCGKWVRTFHVSSNSPVIAFALSLSHM